VTLPTLPTCKHFTIRYVLTDAEGADGVDDRGRPYRDICLTPKEVFGYAAAIGSNFKDRVVEATCRDCGARSWGHLRSCP